MPEVSLDDLANRHRHAWGEWFPVYFDLDAPPAYRARECFLCGEEERRGEHPPDGVGASPAGTPTT